MPSAIPVGTGKGIDVYRTFASEAQFDFSGGIFSGKSGEFNPRDTETLIDQSFCIPGFIATLRNILRSQVHQGSTTIG
jgi:hypothetical protein